MTEPQSINLAKGLAFVIVHADGSKTLHVFTENGTMSVPKDARQLYQVGAGGLAFDGSVAYGYGATGALR